MKFVNAVRTGAVAAGVSGGLGACANDLEPTHDEAIGERSSALTELAAESAMEDVCTKWCKDCPTCNIYCCELTLEELTVTPTREEAPAERALTAEPSKQRLATPDASPAGKPPDGHLAIEEPVEEACTKMCKTCEQCEPFCCQATSFEDLL